MALADRPRPDESLVVLVRGEHERDLTLRLLQGEGVRARGVASVGELCDLVARQEVTAALLAEELLDGDALERLGLTLSRQPPWSDLPLVVFGAISSRVEERGRLVLGNVTFLDRPVRVRTMLSAVRAALRSRERQHEAREAIESRDAFLAMLGHELRNPLGAIRLALTMHGEKTGGPGSTRELAVIDRQSAHLARLVDDLLDVARVMNNKISLAREIVEIGPILRGALEALAGRAATARIELELHLPDAPVHVDADRQRLEQVFANILGNAIKYTGAGGHVDIDVKADDRVTIEVRDTGVGISAAMLPRVFDAFAQADGSLDRSAGGIGLGLSLVKSIVELHGGEVRAESPGLGLGSTISVVLPRRAAPATSVAASLGPTAGETPSPRRVVVVDDGEDIRELLAELLSLGGHSVTTGEDGPSGLAAIVDSAPDVAFVDIGLPIFDGFEIARRVREQHLPVRLVAMSGYGQPSDKERAREAGFDEHLTKPVSDAALRDALQRTTPAPRRAS